MSGREQSRREFLLKSLSGVGAAWAVANYAGIEDAAAFVQQSARTTSPAFSSPRPRPPRSRRWPRRSSRRTRRRGAREARVIVFIDRILTTFEKDAQADYTKGLAALAAQTKQTVPSATSFAALTSEQQIQVLTAMEKTPFFNLVRTHTITGFFAAPSHGGNANKVGWTLVRCYNDSLNHKAALRLLRRATEFDQPLTEEIPHGSIHTSHRGRLRRHRLGRRRRHHGKQLSTAGFTVVVLEQGGWGKYGKEHEY